MPTSPGILPRPNFVPIQQSLPHQRPNSGMCGPWMPHENRPSLVLPSPFQFSSSPIKFAPKKRYDVDSADRQPQVKVKLRDQQRPAKEKTSASFDSQSHTMLNASSGPSANFAESTTVRTSESFESSVQSPTVSGESRSLPPRSKPSSSRKSRVEGSERFEYIDDDTRRKTSRSRQIKQIKIDLMRLLLTTGTHSALLVIPPSLKVHKFATAGDFDSFLEMYAALLFAQKKKKKKHKIKFRIDDLWERFNGRGGQHQIETLCSALHELGCNEDTVEELKDSYLAAIARSENPDDVCRSLAKFLTRSINDFCLSTRRRRRKLTWLTFYTPVTASNRHR